MPQNYGWSTLIKESCMMWVNGFVECRSGGEGWREVSVKVTTTDILKEFLWPTEETRFECWEERLEDVIPGLEMDGCLVGWLVGPRWSTIRTTTDKHFWFSSGSSEDIQGKRNYRSWQKVARQIRATRRHERNHNKADIR